MSIDGTIYVHCDWRLSGAMRLVLDEIFGENCIKNISFENAKSKLDKFISLYKL